MASLGQQYANLRTLLDSLELAALRYYLSASNGSEKNKRYDELNDLIRPVMLEIWGGFNIDCPPGFYDCDGCCVPYKCFVDSGVLTASTTRARSAKKKSAKKKR